MGWVEGAVGGRIGAVDEAGAGELRPLNFSALALISNPENYPWCVNCKLYIEFPPYLYVASGVLIDPTHVITAGHNVHEGGGGSWASGILVVPAYKDGQASYGYASAVGLHTWGGWAVDGNFDYDMGVIDLDRPVGALTGWHGYGYDDDPSFYTGNTFYNPGYPAEPPYDGQHMYYWYGNFDFTESTEGTWYGNEVGIDRRAYGGQSGSGAYHEEGATRTVYAVLSNGNIFVTKFPRITSTMFGHIGGFISDDTPSAFDLIPLSVIIQPQTIIAGDQLSEMGYLVHNYSSVSWGGTVYVDVYLSSDDNISTADTLVQSHYFSWVFAPKSSVWVNVPTPPTIPPGTAEGDYWIGVILDISDYNTGNNESDGQDAGPINVVEPAVSISLVTDGLVDYGICDLGSTADNSGDVEVVQVDTGPAELDVKSSIFSNGGESWSLGAANGEDQVVWEFSPDGSAWTIFETAETQYPLAGSVAEGASQDLYLRLTLPTSSSSGDEFSATVTLIATAP